MNPVSVLLVGVVYLLAEPGLIAVLAQNSSDMANEQKTFKYNVGISEAGSFEPTCAGSIVSKRWILTLLSCVESMDFTVNFATFSINLGFTSVYAYPSQFQNVALIELPVELVFNTELGEVSYSLPDDAKKLDGKKGSMLASNQFMPTSSETYAIMSAKECQQKMLAMFDPNHQLCALDQGFGSMSTMGSGLIIEDKNGPILVGLYLEPSSPMGIPATFIKVSAYEEWIKQTVAGKSTAQQNENNNGGSQ